MANSGAAVLGVMLVGVLAVALLFGSQIIGFVSGLPDRIQDWIEQIRGTFPNAGGDVEGQTWIGYTIYYVDGSIREINDDAPSFSLFPLSISDTKGEVSSVTVNLKAKLDGDISSWTGQVSMQTELYKKGESTPKTSSTVNYTKSGAGWNGETKILASYSVTAGELEDIVWSYGIGEYVLQFLGTVDLTVTSEGAQVDLSAACPSGSLTVLFLKVSPPSSFSMFGESVTFGEEN